VGHYFEIKVAYKLTIALNNTKYYLIIMKSHKTINYKNRTKSVNIFRAVYYSKKIVFITIFTIIGVLAIVLTKAATPFASIDLGAGSTVTSPAFIGSNDSTASGGSYIGFGTASSSCIGRPNTVTLTGSQQQYPGTVTLANDTTIDARKATWDNASATDYPVHFQYTSSTTRTNLCLVGGKISSTYPSSTTWDYWHSVTGLRVRIPGFNTDGVRIHNEGDGIGFSDATAGNWTMRNAHLSFIHDDCVENDYMHNGLVENSLLDGCYVAFSSRGHSGQTVQPNGLDETFAIKDSLVRLQPMPTVYKGVVPGHGGLFKWSGDPATEGYGTKLSVHNTIFRVDQLPNHGSLGIPTYVDPTTGQTKSYLADCSNNIIVWLGTGSYPATMPSCFTITTDKAIWDNAVAKWLAAHPDNL
jgi:hypothetical protein